LRLARQAISLDLNFAAAYGLILDCFAKQRDQGWITEDDVAAEGKQHALHIIEVGADDAFALSRAAQFFSLVLKDVGTGEAIVDQAVAVNPNLADAWRIRGWISVFLGQHETALEQLNYTMRLNPLDPQIHFVESGLAYANFFLRRFEIALSWATKSLARQNNHGPTLGIAMASYAMLDRITDAHIMMVRRHEAGWVPTISRNKLAQYQRQEDVELFIEACRIAGMRE
jgi:adenylate cyclase